MKGSRQKTLTRVVALASIGAIALSLVFSFLLFDQTSTRFKREAEFHAFRVMTGALDRYTFDPQFDPSQLPEVRGFGVYSAQGQALYQWGTAPTALDQVSREESASFVRVKDNSVTVIRETGTMPPRHMRHGFFGAPEHESHSDDPAPTRRRMMDSPSGSRAHRSGMGMHMGRYVFADVEMTSFFHARRLRLLSLSILALIFITSISLAFAFSRRVAHYRSREANRSHLVQLGEAARTLAHEIKNPLGVIRVQCATLTKTIPETYRKNISVIEEETERLSQLTDRLRDFLQNSEGSPRIVSARLIMEQCALRYAGRVEVLSRDVGEALVWIDPDRIVQVLDNLIANALESHSLEMPNVSLETRQGHAVFTVSDRGNGIAPEHRPSLFTPFFTTKPKGSGIGLALSRRFITLAGGSLEWSERPGGGSLFIASIPLAKDQSRREAEHG